MSATALLYRAAPRWQFSAAFVGAALLHLAAIGIAANRRVPPPSAAAAPDAIEILVGPETVDQTLPTDPVETPPPPPPPPASDEAFVPEESATPPPVRRVERQRQPLPRPLAGAPASPTGMRAAKVLALSAPQPEYPYEARRQRVTGSGIALLTVDAGGRVTDVTMVRSTGHAVLDHATTSGFRRWRSVPGTVSKVQTPVTYTLAGASY